MKPTGNSDGPEAKKAKVDTNETIVVKKVDDITSCTNCMKVLIFIVGE